MMWSRESKSQKLKKKVKDDFEHALTLAESPLRDNRIICVRVALKCRANIDAAFAKAAREFAQYEELALIAVADGREAPPVPVADPFQLVKSGDEFTYTYIPARSAEQIFALGAAYQTLRIGRGYAIEQAQKIANELWIELGLMESLEVLRFLREEEHETTLAGSPEVE